jgi:hypothetical protein
VDGSEKRTWWYACLYGILACVVVNTVVGILALLFMPRIPVTGVIVMAISISAGVLAAYLKRPI